MKLIKNIIAGLSRCKYAKKCRYYDKQSYTCNRDNGYGCGVCRDWNVRKDARKENLTLSMSYFQKYSAIKEQQNPVVARANER